MRSSLLIYLGLSIFAMNAAPAQPPFVTFSDPEMQFTFSYPDDFRSLPPVEPQLAGCLTIPLRLAGKSERPYERILVHETDYNCLRRNTPEIGPFTKSTENDLMKVYGYLEMSEPSKFLFDGHPAAFITAKAKVSGPMKGLEPGMILYAVQSCVALDSRVVCWNVLTSDRTRLNSLLAGKIAFDGHPGHAWALLGKSAYPNGDILNVLP
jgi:hypothetical protein